MMNKQKNRKVIDKNIKNKKRKTIYKIINKII